MSLRCKVIFKKQLERIHTRLMGKRLPLPASLLNGTLVTLDCLPYVKLDLFRQVPPDIVLYKHLMIIIFPKVSNPVPRGGEPMDIEAAADVSQEAPVPVSNQPDDPLPDNIIIGTCV